MAEITNIHGRRWGRGIRPWLLIPKYFCVALAIGGIASAGIVTLRAMALPPEQRASCYDLVGGLFRYQIIPSVAAAMLFGLGLLLQHPREFLRMRWLRLKLALVAVGVPSLHLLLSLSLGRLRANPAEYPLMFVRGLMLALGLLILVAAIGRLKPRLHQPYTP